MRLFLSSQDLGHHADRAYELCGPGKRVALISNAGDGYDPAERADKAARKVAMFEAANFKCEQLDLRDYFGKKDELAERLKSFDLVWCNGGNTFILRRAMRASGFDEIIKTMLAEDSIMYGGSSAGSCVCAPTLHGIEHGDRPHPDVVPENYPNKQTVWEGLGLVRFMIVPHSDQEWFRPNIDPTVRALDQAHIPYLLLNDGEVVIVDGDKTDILVPDHENTRYRPIAQKPFCCVPTSLQMVLEKNGLFAPSQEALGNELGLVVPPEYADDFENVQVSEQPIVSSGFGTRIQDSSYSLENLIAKYEWPFTLTKRLASTIQNPEDLVDTLKDIESINADALVCMQNDRGYGHVVVFDRIFDGAVRIVDPSPESEKWRSLPAEALYERIQAHGDSNMAGLWILERL